MSDSREIPYRLRRIDDDRTVDTASMTPEKAKLANERLSTTHCREYGVPTHEWVEAEVKKSPESIYQGWQP